MNKALRVIKFYVLCNKLKSLVRTGWLDWNVNSERVESVAEHIYGVQMLALAMYFEYQYDIDIERVIYMLAVHELEETIIGDLTYLQISKEDKDKIGHEAVNKILSELLNSDDIRELIYEFDSRVTPESVFAYHCDKLECDLQCKLYDEAGCVDPFNQSNERLDYNLDVMRKLRSGEATWSSCWMENDRSKFLDDNNFVEVLNYAMDNPITLEKVKKID